MDRKLILWLAIAGMFVSVLWIAAVATLQFTGMMEWNIFIALLVACVPGLVGITVIMHSAMSDGTFWEEYHRLMEPHYKREAELREIRKAAIEKFLEDDDFPLGVGC